MESKACHSRAASAVGSSTTTAILASCTRAPPPALRAPGCCCWMDIMAAQDSSVSFYNNLYFTSVNVRSGSVAKMCHENFFRITVSYAVELILFITARKMRLHGQESNP